MSRSRLLPVSIEAQPMDDRSLIHFLLGCPAFEDVVRVTDDHIIATFSDRDAVHQECFFKDLKDTQRQYILTGHEIHFPVLGTIHTKHFITIRPERKNILAWLGKLRFELR